MWKLRLRPCSSFSRNTSIEIFCGVFLLAKASWNGGVLEPNKATEKKRGLIEEVITRGPQIVFFFVPTKPLQSTNKWIGEARTRVTVLVKSKERTGRSQTLPLWEGVRVKKDDRKKYISPIGEPNPIHSAYGLNCATLAPPLCIFDELHI